MKKKMGFPSLLALSVSAVAGPVVPSDISITETTKSALTPDFLSDTKSIRLIKMLI
ncbi:MAG: hypothetical protein WDW21_05415 [Neisseriaceae bacterium]